MLRRGVENGELRADLDVEAAMALLLGALVPRRPRETYPDGHAEAVVGTLLRGIGTVAR